MRGWPDRDVLFDVGMGISLNHDEREALRERARKAGRTEGEQAEAENPEAFAPAIKGPDGEVGTYEDIPSSRRIR